MAFNEADLRLEHSRIDQTLDEDHGIDVNGIACGVVVLDEVGASEELVSILPAIPQDTGIPQMNVTVDYPDIWAEFYAYAPLGFSSR